MVCIAASNSGDTSQDLKTGYIVGSTPRLQQIALMIGVVVSTVVIGFTLNLMNTGLQEFHAAAQPWDINAAHPGVAIQSDTHTCPTRSASSAPTNRRPLIRSPNTSCSTPSARRSCRTANISTRPRPTASRCTGFRASARPARPPPQARLMATVINGILSRKLPWGLVLLGVSLVIAVELLGIRSLPFAVGAYLPIGTTLPIFCGRRSPLARRSGREARRRRSEAESEISPGSLFASGLIAAGGIAGLFGVALKAVRSHLLRQSRPLNFPHTFLDHNVVSVLAFARSRIRCTTSRGSR